MTDNYAQTSAAPAPSYSSPAPATPAPDANPYLGNGGTPQPATQSPLMAQPGDSRFYQAPPDLSQQISRPGDQSWNESQLANQQDQNADKTGAIAIGDTVQLMDGTAYVHTEQQAQVTAALYNSVESHFGQGQFDSMVQFATANLSHGEQSSLERMLLSGDTKQMERAVNYVADRMARNAPAGARHGYQPQRQQQTVGLSSAEFMAALQQLEQHYHPGQHQYQQHYQSLVQQRAAGKRSGR